MEKQIIIDNDGFLKEVTFDELYCSEKMQGLIGYYNNKFKNIPVDKEEISAYINIGFYRCWQDYDYSKGGKFSTFAFSYLNLFCLKLYSKYTSKKEVANRENFSLEYEINGGKDGKDGTTFEETLIVNYKDFVDDIDYKEKLRRLLKVLNEQESAIAYYLMQGYNFVEIGQVYKVSHQRIQQIWEKAKDKMILTADILFDMEVF